MRIIHKFLYILLNIEFSRFIHFYSFVDSSCQYSCSNKESLFSSSVKVVMSSISFSCSFSLSVTADRLARTELTEMGIKCNSWPSFVLIYTKIDAAFDWGGEVEGGGAHHAHDDRVVEEDHDERCLEADSRLGSVLLFSPNCSGASLDSSGQAGAGAEMADNVITCFDGEWVGLDEAKNRADLL